MSLSDRRLSDFRAMTFDCYGTLIDWEAGILAELRPWAARQRGDLGDDTMLATFAQTESALEQEQPGLIYRDLLSEVHRRLAQQWGIAADEKAALRFGDSVPRWPAFPDSAEALAYLKQHYTLVILSNVHDKGIEASAAKLGNPFTYIFTAQQIGSYKPDKRNFDYMLGKMQGFGFAKGEILHTAQSLYHDHVPAQALGMASCWIDRRAGKQGTGATKPMANPPKVQFRFETLGQLAEAHRAEQRTR